MISGKDKGAKGKSCRRVSGPGQVLVEGVNRIKKHTAISTTQRGAGGIVLGIHVSNVMSG